MDADDIRRQWDVIPGGKAEEAGSRMEGFRLEPIRIAGLDKIPHRQWIYGTHLIRGYVTLLVAPGGTGKSSLLLAMLMGIAINRSLLGAHIFQPCNTALLNLEDPQDEIARRMAALAIRYGVTQREIEDRFFTSPEGQVVTIAANDGFSVCHPDEKAIIAELKARNIGVLAVDPFAESHTLEENSNPQMIQAAAAWRRVARTCNCAVILSHHVRKGPAESIEAARGAKALSDSARIGLLLSNMTAEEAVSLDVPEDNRQQYVRLDDAKSNMAQRAPKATWFHLNNVTLDNADEIYTRGDQVGVIEAWQPTSTFGDLTDKQCNAALDTIEAGPEPGSRYTRHRTSEDTGRWAGNVLVDQLGVSDARAKAMLANWLKAGVLRVEKYYDKAQRHERSGLFVNDTNRPGERL